MPDDMSLKLAIARQTDEWAVEHIRQSQPLRERIAAGDYQDEQIIPERELFQSVGQGGCRCDANIGGIGAELCHPGAGGAPGFCKLHGASSPTPMLWVTPQPDALGNPLATRQQGVQNPHSNCSRTAAFISHRMFAGYAVWPTAKRNPCK
jgi:hypothetical protein